MDEFNVYVLGCGSALSMHGRHPSGQIIQYGDIFCLIDCGEGTQSRLNQYGIKPFKIEMIFISHLHGDHVFGLPGLLSSLAHLKRTTPLTVYGPIGIKGFLESIFTYTSQKITYPLSIVENDIDDIKTIWSNDRLEILTFPLNHRVPCNGYLFREIGHSIKLRKEQIEAHALTVDQIKAITRQQDVLVNGKSIPASVFIHPPQPRLSYAYCSDTRYDEKIIRWIGNVSVLFHETTFMNDKEVLANQTGHSTAQQAARIAKMANANCLMTGHFSSRYKDLLPLLDEVKEKFSHAILAEEGKKYKLRSLVNHGLQ